MLVVSHPATVSHLSLALTGTILDSYMADGVQHKALQELECREDGIATLEREYGLGSLMGHSLPSDFVCRFRALAAGARLKIKIQQHKLDPTIYRECDMFRAVQNLSEAMETLANAGLLSYLQDTTCVWISAAAGALRQVGVGQRSHPATPRLTYA
jgi:hypothetical protein